MKQPACLVAGKTEVREVSSFDVRERREHRRRPREVPERGRINGYIYSFLMNLIIEFYIYTAGLKFCFS